MPWSRGRVSSTLTWIAAAFIPAACGQTTGVLLRAAPTDASVDAVAPMDEDATTGTKALLSASDEGTCAISSTGAIECWGANEDASVVPGEPSVIASPVAVWPGNSWVAIGGGSGHCALDEDAGMWCWGPDEAVPGSEFASLTQVVAPSGRWGGAAVGRGHYAALTTDGTLYVWGANDAGQLGLGDTDSRDSPTAVPGVWNEVAAGWMHTCGIRDDGGVYCWGAGEEGQLGTGAEPVVLSPSKVAVPFALHVAAGGNDSCAITSGGSLYCWGENVYGELGVGDTVVHSTPAVVQGSYRAVAVGGGTTCAVASEGTLVCMGFFGQSTAEPNQSSSPWTYDTRTDWLEVTAGVSHACAARTGAQVACLGWNFDGQLGSDAGIYSATLVDVGF